MVKIRVNDSLSFSTLLMNQTRQRSSDSLLTYLQTLIIMLIIKAEN